MPFFVFPWIVLVIGIAVHILVDRSPRRRSRHRIVELSLLWVLVWFGVWSIVGGLGHIGPNSGELATQIGYAQSMFQWEVGWGDIALGVLGIGCAWRALRDGWMTAAVVVLVIMYWGDAIGHIMQYVAHDNTAPSNVWAIPSDIVQPLIAVILLILYRRGEVKQRPTTGTPAARSASYDATSS